MGKRLKAARHYVDYFLPREIIGPVILIFSIENIVDRLFELYMPAQSQLIGWIMIAIFAGLLVKEWGEADEEMEELEEELEKIENEEED